MLVVSHLENLNFGGGTAQVFNEALSDFQAKVIKFGGTMNTPTKYPPSVSHADKANSRRLASQNNYRPPNLEEVHSQVIGLRRRYNRLAAHLVSDLAVLGAIMEEEQCLTQTLFGDLTGDDIPPVDGPKSLPDFIRSVASVLGPEA